MKQKEINKILANYNLDYVYDDIAILFGEINYNINNVTEKEMINLLDNLGSEFDFTFKLGDGEYRFIQENELDYVLAEQVESYLEEALEMQDDLMKQYFISRIDTKNFMRYFGVGAADYLSSDGNEYSFCDYYIYKVN